MKRLLSMCAISTCSLAILSGCVSGPQGMAKNYSGSLTDDLGESNVRVARMQQGLQGPPPVTGTAVNAGGIDRTQSYKVTVRCWVNGKPLFDEEVFQGLSPAAIQRVNGLKEPERTEQLGELMRRQIDQAVDQELLYQDAVSKLQKGNPKALEKIQGLATAEYEKQMRARRQESKMSEDQLREIGKLMQRMVERNFIATEYLRSRIFPLIERGSRPDAVREYYETHQNEFQKQEKVEWQDVFISASKHGSVANARRVAEDLIQTCRTSEDFKNLLQHNEGIGAIGDRRGSIEPREVEEYLFKMRDGEIGPVVEIGTGVHIIRLVKRDPGGVIPFNDETQLRIRSKLRNELADREVKRIVRELRSRAVIEIDGEGALQ